MNMWGNKVHAGGMYECDFGNPNTGTFTKLAQNRDSDEFKSVPLLREF
jgi:hypothetical protein